MSQVSAPLSSLWLAFIILSACQEAPKVSPAPARPAAPAQVSPEHKAAYKPGPNPLAALYGTGEPEEGVEARFQRVTHLSPHAPMHSAWIKAYQTLEAGRAQVKLSAWSSTERSRLDQPRADYAMRWTLHLLGERQLVSGSLRKALAPASSFTKLVPSALGDELQHEGAQGDYMLTVKAETLWKQRGRVYVRADIEWVRRAPDPTGELRNCRYLKGLTPPSTGVAPWLSAVFKTNSKRRLAEWSYQRGDRDAPRWTGLWVYRNGSLRDKGVRWWSDALSAQGGHRVEMRGMEQRWRLPSGEEVTWWSESDPEQLGCLLEAPLLSVSWIDKSAE